jgi:hypothetical protein
MFATIKGIVREITHQPISYTIAEWITEPLRIRKMKAGK